MAGCLIQGIRIRGDNDYGVEAAFLLSAKFLIFVGYQN